jgi:hypothetical protein
MRALLLLLALVLTPLPARAQLALPGAVATPTPAGQTMAPPATHSGPRKTESSGSGPAIRPKPPTESATLGQTLSLNGTRGAILIEKNGGALAVTRLVLTGSKISQPNHACSVSMGEDGPIRLQPLGAPDGATRFELDSSACPMLIDLLGGALRVSAPFGACAFPQADCRADVAGLWGPPGAAFGASQIKTFERERAGLEKSVQARFRELLKAFKKKPDLASALVKEHADFAASRATICRDYDKEDAHGFCALRLTEARDLALQARLADARDEKAKEKAEKAEKARRQAERKQPAPAKRKDAAKDHRARPAAAPPPPPPPPGLF